MPQDYHNFLCQFSDLISSFLSQTQAFFFVFILRLRPPLPSSLSLPPTLHHLRAASPLACLEGDDGSGGVRVVVLRGEVGGGVINSELV